MHNDDSNNSDYISDDFQINPGQNLEPLEQRVLRRLADGDGPGKIQRELNLKPVELTIVKDRLHRKLGAKNIAQLINRAWITGVITTRLLSVLVICCLLAQLTPDQMRPNQRPNPRGSQRISARTVSVLRIRGCSV